MKKYIFIILVICFYSNTVLASLAIQFWHTSSGARVYFVESDTLPILDIRIEFGAGSSKDSEDKSGLANLTRRMLKLGAGGMSEDEIANALADVGAQLSGNFDEDRAGIALRTLSYKHEREQALDVFSRVIQYPEFSSDVLEREKTRIIAGIKESSTKPDYIADRTLLELLYGDHPYGLNGVGEINTVATIHKKDLVAFYQSYYTATNAVVAMIGNISREEAAGVAELLTAKLSKKTHDNPIQPVANPAGQIKRITHPATQSHIQLAYPGIRRSDPDYFPLLVGNYILGGGGFVSRLMEEIRQQRGLAYSVYSFFSPLQEKGPFQIGLQTKKEQSEEAFTLTQSVLEDFITQGPSERELTVAKQNIIGGFPLRLDSNKKILGYLAMIGFYDLPLTYLDDYLRAVQEVTAAQIRDAFSRRIHPDRMVGVIVGAVEQ